MAPTEIELPASRRNEPPKPPEEPPFFQKALRKDNAIHAVFEVEKPSDYQRGRLLDAVQQIKGELAGLLSTVEAITHINKRLSEIFPNEEKLGDSALLKDIVPAKEGGKPKGNLDCDSRCLLTLSVMQELGREKEAVIVEMTGHTMLYIPASQAFFETLTGKMRKKSGLSERELLEMNALETPRKVQALACANMAASIASEIEAQGQASLFGTQDRNFDFDGKKKEMDRLFMKALELDPEQITLRKNYITMHEKDPQQFETVALFYQTMITTLEGNYRNRVGADTLAPSGIKERPMPADEGEAMLKKSETLQDAYFNYALFCHYEKGDYGKAAELYERLFSANPDGPAYLMGLLGSNFQAGNYKKYIQAYEKHGGFLEQQNIYRLDKEAHYSEYLVSRIISGEIRLTSKNRGEFVRNYGGSALLRPFLEGRENWNIRQFDAVETLKAWEGFPEFKRVLLSKE